MSINRMPRSDFGAMQTRMSAKNESSIFVLLSISTKEPTQMVSMANFVFLESLRKTYKVTEKTFQNLTEWQDHIRLARSCDLIIIQAHGSENGISCGDGSFFTIKDIDPTVFKHLAAQNIPICLLSCNAGKGEFAQRLADHSECRVLASKTSITASSTIITQNLDGHAQDMLSFLAEDKGQQIVWEFKPHRNVSEPLPPNALYNAPLYIQKLLNHNIAILRCMAAQGILGAQCILGDYAVYGGLSPIIPKSIEQGFVCYVGKGLRFSIDRICTIGLFYEKAPDAYQQSIERAIQCYSFASRWGNRTAKEHLAILSSDQGDTEKMD